MNIARLEHLKEIAARIDIGQLDMGSWGASCGSPACLAGWACRDELFRRQGLHMEAGVPAFRGYDAFSALDKFFGLYGMETTHLFSPIAYKGPTREELLQHIDDILAGDFEEKFGAQPKYLRERAA